MVLGLGVDFTTISRVNLLFQKRGDRFLKKFLSNSELQEFKTLSKNHPHLIGQFLAGRFEI